MKPCRSYRKRLAVWASGEVEPSEAAALRGHCAQCPACAAYIRELSLVCAEHRAAERAVPGAEFADSEVRFHQEWRARILAGQEPDDVRRPLAEPFWRSPRAWRWALVGGAAVLLGTATWIGWRGGQDGPPGGLVHQPETAPVSNLAVPMASPSPASVQSYRWAAARSPEAFEMLLARNARDSEPESVPIHAFSRRFPEVAD